MRWREARSCSRLPSREFPKSWLMGRLDICLSPAPWEISWLSFCRSGRCWRRHARRLRPVFIHRHGRLLTFARRPGHWTGCGTRPRCRSATTSIAPRIFQLSATYSSGRSPPRERVFFMRILYCNKYNYPFSGTEVYLFELMQLMRSQGHEVALFSMADPRGEPTPYDHNFVPHVDFKADSGLWETARRTANAIYSRDARRRMRAMIDEFRPDVAHVRNIYHHLSPSILWELKAQKIPVLYHLNDFKILCPSYNLVSHGGACEKCKGGKFRHMMEAKCYPGMG